MKHDTCFEDKRLLEALDHIDERFVAELVNGLDLPTDTPAPADRKKTVWRSLRYVAAIAACALLLGAVVPMISFVVSNLPEFHGFVGPGTSDIGEESTQSYEIELPDALAEDIILAFFDEYRKKDAEVSDYCVTCYGIYGDVYAVTVVAKEDPYPSEIRSTERVNGLKFVYPNYSNRLWLYRDGDLYAVLEGYVESLMGMDSFKDLHARHSAAFSQLYKAEEEIDEPIPPGYLKFSLDLEELTEAEMLEIRDAYAEYQYAKTYDSEYKAWSGVFDEEGARKAAEDEAKSAADRARNKLFSGDHYNSRYYGKFGDAVVVAVVGNTTEGKTYSFGDCSLSFAYGAAVYVYVDGEITELEDACRDGSVTEADFGRIAQRHEEYEAYLFGNSKFEYDEAKFPASEGSDSPDAIEKFGVCVDGKYYNALEQSKYSIVFCGYANDGGYLWSSMGESLFPYTKEEEIPEGCPIVVAKTWNDVQLIGEGSQSYYLEYSTLKYYQESPTATGIYWLLMEGEEFPFPSDDPNFVPPETYPHTYVLQYNYVVLLIITGQ